MAPPVARTASSAASFFVAFAAAIIPVRGTAASCPAVRRSCTAARVIGRGTGRAGTRTRPRQLRRPAPSLAPRSRRLFLNGGGHRRRGRRDVAGRVRTGRGERIAGGATEIGRRDVALP